jgi:hypothetical protein
MTTTPSKPKDETAEGADLQGAIDELRSARADDKPKRGGRRPGAGRPRGARTRNRAEGARPGAPEPSAFDTSPPTEAEIQVMSRLGSVLWLVAGKIVPRGLTPLEDGEKRELGEAIVPLWRKYASALAGWEPEAGFVVCFGGLVMGHVKPAAPAEEIETAADAIMVPPQEWKFPPEESQP